MIGDVIQSGITENTWTPDVDLPPGPSYWWVRGITSEGRPGAWSVRSTVDTEGRAVVEGPELAFDSVSLDITWSSVGLATHYDVHIERTSTTEVIFRQDGITSTSVTIDPLTDDEYHVWVRAHQSGTRGPWSLPMTMLVDGRPTLLGPIGSISESAPTFEWTAIGGASRYILHIEDADRNIVFREDDLLTTSYTTPSTMAAGSYRAWVKAINASDNSTGIWSNPLDIIVVNTDTFIMPDDATNGYLAGDNLLKVNLLEMKSLTADQIPATYEHTNRSDVRMATESPIDMSHASDFIARPETDPAKDSATNEHAASLTTDHMSIDQLMIEELQLLSQV